MKSVADQADNQGEGRLSELQELVDALKPVVDVLNEIAAPHYCFVSHGSSDGEGEAPAEPSPGSRLGGRLALPFDDPSRDA